VSLNEEDRAVVRSCLDQVTIGMYEAREVLTWWQTLGEKRRQEWKDFQASALYLRRCLDEKVVVTHIE
jgi:hypothetical protein